MEGWVEWGAGQKEEEQSRKDIDQGFSVHLSVFPGDASTLREVYVVVDVDKDED